MKELHRLKASATRSIPTCRDAIGPGEYLQSVSPNLTGLAAETTVGNPRSSELEPWIRARGEKYGQGVFGGGPGSLVQLICNSDRPAALGA